LAKAVIDNEKPLLIVNCHQFIDWDATQFHRSCENSRADGVIATFFNNHPRYSYVTVDENGLVTDLAEKKTISSIATCGVYYWKRGHDFISFAEKLLKPSTKMSDCSVIMAYKMALQAGLKFETFSCDFSWQLKFPKDLEAFYRAKKPFQI
jgi:hypothetical protein